MGRSEKPEKTSGKVKLIKDVEYRLRYEDRKKRIPSFWVRLHLPSPSSMGISF